MIIECDRCYARYRYDEARFDGKASKKVRCTKCLAIFEIFNEKASPAPPVSPGVRSGEETILRLADDTATAREAPPKKTVVPTRRPGAAELKMPVGFKVSVAVIAGPEAGRMYAVEKPRVVIGRHDADINVDDPEISRAHAAIELSGDRATLLDLGSTNGTFVGEEQIEECPLENQSEFSIGGSTLMLIFTPRSDRPLDS
jgi:predicted Zn finger-like uncharacterized protein